MRLHGRHLTRQDILAAVSTYEIIEAYPEDKYLPSYLVLAENYGVGFHVLFATDIENDNIRVVTAYRPDLEEWEPDLRTRRNVK
jgi:hypothetical protein